MDDAAEVPAVTSVKYGTNTPCTPDRANDLCNTEILTCVVKKVGV